MTTDEKGNELVSAVVEIGACAYCWGSFEQRAAGRLRRFCSSRCRVKFWRSTRGV